jgi:hypothetical protein
VTLKYVGEPAMLVSNKMDLADIRQDDGAAAIIDRGRGRCEIGRTYGRKLFDVLILRPAAYRQKDEAEQSHGKAAHRRSQGHSR